MKLLVLTTLCAFLAHGSSLEGFNKRFKLKRNGQGELVSVKMVSFNKSFSLRPYLVKIKNDLKSEIQRMKYKSYNNELEDFLIEISDNDALKAASNDNVAVVRDSLENLRSINVDKTYQDVTSKGVLKRFEFDLKKALKMLDLSILADPTDSKYFYRKNVTYEVVKRALNFAKKRFDSIPLLNFASFLIVKVHELVLEQRVFNQNMLLHYLENFSAKELGMSEEELDYVRSSIYESRISALNFRESKKAATNWRDYGANKFFSIVRLSNTRLRRSGHKYYRTARINYAFANSEYKNEKVILDLVNRKHTFSSKMPIAYYYNRPNKVKRFRNLLSLANAGLGFLPIPGWIKSNAQGFIESFYVQQRRDEGALLGYLESVKDYKMFDLIKRQNNNPYIIF